LFLLVFLLSLGCFEPFLWFWTLVLLYRLVCL